MNTQSNNMQTYIIRFKMVQIVNKDNFSSNAVSAKYQVDIGTKMMKALVG